MPARFILAGLLVLAGGDVVAQGRIGYVNFDQLLENSPQRAARLDTLTRRFESRALANQENERELAELEDRLVRDAAIMGEARREALERQVRTLRRQVQRDKEDLLEEMEFARNEELTKLTDEIYQVVERWAKLNDYDLILASPALYYSESIDLTERLLEELNKAHDATPTGN
ncbi:MAG: OmpH family outer membrane protein [Pseudomonadota bacterium]